MAYKVIEESSVQAELSSALDYLEFALYEPVAAKTLAVAYLQLLENLKSSPCMYPKVVDLRLRAKGYRKALIRGYVVLFRVQADQVMVIHLFHQLQDYARLV